MRDAQCLAPRADACLIERDTSEYRSAGGIILGNGPAANSFDLAWGTLLAFGPGRVAVHSERSVPTMAALGWRPGDRVLYLDRFKLFDASAYGFGKDTAIVADFDVFARAGDDHEDADRRALEPNWGRVVLTAEKRDNVILRGGLQLHTALKEVAHGGYAVGRVQRVAPILRESTGPNPHAPRGTMSSRVTLDFDGIQETLGFGIGDRVVYGRDGSARGTLPGSNVEYVVANTASVHYVVPEGVEVRLS